MQHRLIGPLSISVARRTDAVARIVSIVKDRSANVVSFANAHTVDAARRNYAFRAASREIVFFNDGIGVDVWSRIVWGERFPENCNGTDLMPEVVAALPAGTRIYLIGDQAKVADLAANQIQRLNSGVVIGGIRSGFFAPERQDEIIAAITPEVDLVIAALGQPKQEMFALEVARRTGRPVICVGAWFGFVSGTLSRAPKTMRKLRLEWAYRLAREPRRLSGRYLGGAVRLAAGSVGQRLGRRRRSR